LIIATSMCVCSAIAPGVYMAEVKFGIEKLGATSVYPCPNVLAIVCCGILKAGVKPSMVVRLWKWFTGWVEGFGIDVPHADASLVCRLV
jgi:hypothetical protein